LKDTYKNGGGMLLFKKILVPLDGSEHSNHALEKAIQIAKKFEGKITLIHVYSKYPIMIAQGYAHLEVIPQLIDAARKAGTKILVDGQRKVKAANLKVTTLLEEGHAVDEILKTCKKGKFDLIIMGARGISTIKEIFLGSVSHGVTMHSQCPVLIIK
jgi:nucleotide-binding universal stress UspA family protein